MFFDRSPLDHVIGLKRLGIPVPPLVEAAAVHCRYHFTVFLVPPWQEIYVTDAERRHSFEAAVEEYQGLVQGYQSLQFRVVILPHTTVAERADIVEREL